MFKSRGAKGPSFLINTWGFDPLSRRGGKMRLMNYKGGPFFWEKFSSMGSY